MSKTTREMSVPQLCLVAEYAINACMRHMLDTGNHERSHEQVEQFVNAACDFYEVDHTWAPIFECLLSNLEEFAGIVELNTGRELLHLDMPTGL